MSFERSETEQKKTKENDEISTTSREDVNSKHSLQNLDPLIRKTLLQINCPSSQLYKCSFKVQSDCT